MSMRLWTISTFLSLSRAPLALLILIDHSWWRVSVMLLIILTDIMDGYLARKTNSITSFGAFIDPLMDRFVIVFVLALYL
ncbi:CDP-alcohol phosphatidyltransferase family protein, partial [Acinetobacter baumannii]